MTQEVKLLFNQLIKMKNISGVIGGMFLGAVITLASVGIFTGRENHPKQQHKQVEVQNQIENKTSLEYRLPGDFKDIINISYGYSPLSAESYPIVTYRTSHGELRSQMYNTHGTTNSQPITWIQPQHNQK